MKWKIGCSGFYYREWKEFFYPKGLVQKDWFKFYCEHFNTIEINSSFYKMPSVKSLEKWYNESPADFSLTMKAPRLITHYKKLKDCKKDLAEFEHIIDVGLGNKLACILFQFPPSFIYTDDNLKRLIELLNVNSQNVVEFRHLSWWNEKVYENLAANHIIFAGQSYPSNLPEEIITTNPVVYYRFHGKPVLYKSAYDASFIGNFARKIPSETEQAYVYFNNTWGTGAITNANELMDIIGLI